MAGVLSYMILGLINSYTKSPTTSDISEKARGLEECLEVQTSQGENI